MLLRTVVRRVSVQLFLTTIPPRTLSKPDRYNILQWISSVNSPSDLLDDFSDERRSLAKMTLGSADSRLALAEGGLMSLVETSDDA